MFFSFIEKLRRMPERQRKLFAFGFAFIITFIIFIFWLIFYTFYLDQTTIPVDSINNESLAPFGMLKDSLKDNLKIFGF
ncbi:hypothetical protein IT397_01925 [Candidatus Nomurabacteria bacterium]|nr:hypothetical protein [Candidatus Nomurabacteria bacterium]